VPQCVNLAEFVPRLAYLRQYKVGRERVAAGHRVLQTVQTVRGKRQAMCLLDFAFIPCPNPPGERCPLLLLTWLTDR
jgi:hypothetical protein